MKASIPEQTENLTFLEQCNHFKHYVEMEYTVETLVSEQQIVTNLIKFLETEMKGQQHEANLVLDIIKFHQRRITNIYNFLNDPTPPESN